MLMELAAHLTLLTQLPLSDQYVLFKVKGELTF